MESSLKERLMTWAEKNPIPTTIIALAGIGSFTFLAMKSPNQVSIGVGTFKVQC
jgi:hypothetical protein